MIDSVVAAWWAWMMPMFWQVALLVVTIGIIDTLIRRWAWPQVRHALWLLVLVKLFIPPAWSYPAGIVPIVFGPVVSSAERLQADPASWKERSPAEAAITDRTQSTQAPGESASIPRTPPDRVFFGSFDWRMGLFGIWLGGVVVFTVVLIRRMGRLARWHREQDHRPTIPQWFYDILVETAERLDLDRVPAIVFSKEAVTPAVYGLWRPVMVLPAHYTDELSREEAEHIVLHELSHLKRGDLVVHSVVLLVQIIYWFNPFVAYARRQIKHVRELCCDLTVANVLREKTLDYRRTLLDTARTLLSETVQPSLGLLGVFEEPYKLVARVRWLEKPTWERHRLMIATSWLVVLLVGPVFLPMAASVSEMDDLGSTVNPVVSAQNVSSRVVETEVTAETVHHIRNKFRIDTYVLGFRIDSKPIANTETWVGQSMIASTERGRTTIVDLGRQRLILIDHEAGTWAETELPLDLGAFLSEEALEEHRRIRMTGIVVDTGDSRRFLGRRCRAYDVESWRTRGGGEIIDPERYTVWSTTDVPFDVRLFDALLMNVRLIYNRDVDFRKELEVIRGLQMRLEARLGNFIRSQKVIDEVVGITEAVPPPGTFEAPETYRRVERLEKIGL